MRSRALKIEGTAEEASTLLNALDALPDETIEGLSDYDVRDVILQEGIVVVTKARPYTEPLTVRFPEGSTNAVVMKGVVSFEYREHTYKIHL